MERLFQSLRQQLAFEIVFVENVSRPYHDYQNELDIIDFEYRGSTYQLVLNGKIMLKTKDWETPIESYQDLVHGLIKRKSSAKN